MARQRRGEFPRDRSRRHRRGVALALALTAAGCGRRSPLLPLEVGTGVSGGTQPTSSISGTWRRTLVVQTQMDMVTSETTWVFSVGGGCQRTVVSTSIAEGFPRTQVSPCSYSVAGGRVTVQFSGGTPVSFSVLLSGGSLFLDGQQFVRVG